MILGLSGSCQKIFAEPEQVEVGVCVLLRQVLGQLASFGEAASATSHVTLPFSIHLAERCPFKTSSGLAFFFVLLYVLGVVLQVLVACLALVSTAE